MQAGRYDQQITLQSLVVARDLTYSAITPSYADFATVWSRVTFTNTSAPEPIVAGQQQSTLRATFRIRYLAGVLATMRIKHGDRYYQVLDWNVVGRNKEIWITAVEWNEGRR